MNFALEELLNEIVTSPMENEQKVTLLSRLFKKGQIQDEVFLIKEDDSDEYSIWKREEKDGKTQLTATNQTPEQAIAEYTVSVMKNQTK